MLPLPLPEITEDFLHRVCTEQWPETETLDFKLEVPSNDEEDRDEFRKDIAALANARGGDLVLGVSTYVDRASKVIGFETRSADATIRKFQQILESKVEPRILGVQYHDVQLADGKHVLVLRVPQSFSGPHRVGLVAAHRFVYRDNTKTSDMTYDQLRNAFGARETLLDRARAFRTDRLDRIARRKTPVHMENDPKLVVHIFPIGGANAGVAVDIKELHANNDLFRLPGTDWSRQPNLDGLVRFPYRTSEPMEYYAQIFRHGALEVVRSGEYLNGRQPPVMPGVWAGDLLRNALRAFATSVPALNIRGPGLASLSLIGGANTILGAADGDIGSMALGEDRLEVPEVWMDDVTAIDVDAVSQTILDTFYQAYGRSRCVLFSEGGKWRYREEGF